VSLFVCVCVSALELPMVVCVCVFACLRAKFINPRGAHTHTDTHTLSHTPTIPPTKPGMQTISIVYPRHISNAICKFLCYYEEKSNRTNLLPSCSATRLI